MKANAAVPPTREGMNTQTTTESNSPQVAADQLAELARRIVARAQEKGASASECVIREGREFSTTVRLGQTEMLKEAGGKALGIRVFRGRRVASTYTSDFSWPAIEQMIDSALAIAQVTSDDDCAGLPEASELGAVAGDLKTYSPEVARIPASLGVEWATRCEKAALALDPRLQNSEGGSFDASEGRKIFCNSLGFLGEHRSSYCSMSAVPIAVQDGQMQRDYWYTMGHDLSQLQSPEEVGRIAAERTLRRLGGRKVPTQRVPVIFDPQVARSLLDHVFSAVSGEAIYRGASFWAESLGQQVAHTGLTVIDDGCRPGGFGSTPFDGEGVPTRRTCVIEAGVLQSWLLNCYTARKLKMKTTGNAARGLAGNPGVGYGNLYFEPGQRTPREMIAGVKQGLYVTEFIGMGVNMVTGDYSRGASGLWIENGELTYPVEEITVAGNLKELFRNITEIGNDLEFRSAVASPTLLVEGLTVAGA